MIVTFIERDSTGLLKEFLFSSSSPHVKVKKDAQNREYSKDNYRISSSFLFTKLSPSEAQTINSTKLHIGLDSVDYGYWNKLLRAAKGAPPQTQRSGAQSSSAQNNEQGSYGLGKRLKKLENDETPIGHLHPAALSYKAEFAQAMLIQARTVGQNQSALPHILKIGLNDYHGSVTCVAMCPLFKMFLIGTAKGLIKAVFINKSEETHKADNEEAKDEQKEREATENKEQGAVEKNEGDKIVEDFDSSLNLYEFVGHSSPVVSLSLKYDSNRFVSGALNGEIRLWDIPLRRCLYVVIDHFKCILALKMSPKGDLFASAGSEGIIYLWSEQSTIRVRDYVGHLNDVNQVEFSTNMHYLVSTSLDCTLRLWNIASGECQRIVTFSSSISSFALTLVGDIVICGSELGELFFLDLTKSEKQIFFKCMGPEGTTNDNRIRKVTISVEEKLFAVIKKEHVSLIPIDEVFKARDESAEMREPAQEGGETTQAGSSNMKEYKTMCSASFDNEKFDFISALFTLQNTLVLFCRNKMI